MRIIYFGDGPWAQQAFEQIITLPTVKISMVVLRHNNPDDNLRRKAEEQGIEVCVPENVNAPDFLENTAPAEAELGVSMSYNQIFKKNLIRFFPKGIINCHAGKLPRYRGRNVLNWALINGEKEIGVTCHYIDQGIDTGDIILQKTFPVTEDDDYATVLKKAYELCSEVLIESLGTIHEENVEPKKQPQTGTYYAGRKIGDEFIEWDWNSRRIFNFVRGITTPGPCAQTWLRTNESYERLFIEKINLIEDFSSYNCVAGAVLAKSERGNPLVKTGDTAIELLKYEIEGKRERLNVGDRLGFNINLWLLKQLDRV